MSFKMRKRLLFFVSWRKFNVYPLKESGLSDLAKASKQTELQSLLKEWRSVQEIAQMGAEKASPTSSEPPPQMMGATGPLVFVTEPVKTRKVSEPAPAPAPAPTPAPEGAANPTRPERRSVRKLPNSPNGDSSLEPPCGTLQRQDSKMSISQISMGTPCIPPRPSDIEVPELSYGVNPRMPSVSIGIDLRFAPERGRFFVATQDLLPGNLSSCNLSAFFIEGNLL